MTIEKGKPWGSPCIVPPSRIVVGSDRDLARCRAEEQISLTGGDIWKSLGSPSVPKINAEATEVLIDALEVEIDNGNHLLAASSVEVGTFLGLRRYLCLANASFVGKRNVAPRAHPNDGALDLLEIGAEISWRQRWTASRRALTGTHVPHPHITSRRVRELLIERESSSEILRIDGMKYSTWSSLRVRILPDHWQVLL